MKKVYKVTPQKGEMNYGQPYYGITPNKRELAKIRQGPKLVPFDYFRKVIHTRSYRHTTTCLETGKRSTHFSTSSYSITYHPDRNEWLCHINSFRDVEALANYFGKRMDKSFFERYKNILVEVHA